MEVRLQSRYGQINNNEIMRTIDQRAKNSPFVGQKEKKEINNYIRQPSNYRQQQPNINEGSNNEDTTSQIRDLFRRQNNYKQFFGTNERIISNLKKSKQNNIVLNLSK